MKNLYSTIALIVTVALLALNVLIDWANPLPPEGVLNQWVFLMNLAEFSVYAGAAWALYSLGLFAQAKRDEALAQAEHTRVSTHIKAKNAKVPGVWL